MMQLLNEYRNTLIALLVTASLAGAGVAADDRWLRKADFQEWLSEERRTETLDAIRQLEIEINALESELKWTDDERKASALEERINFLETQVEDLERRL